MLFRTVILFIVMRIIESKLAAIDKSKGGLRLLLVLHDEGDLDQQSLRSKASKMGVGSTSFKSTVNTLQNIGLIRIKSHASGKGQPPLLHSLTEEGRKVAQAIKILANILQGNHTT